MQTGLRTLLIIPCYNEQASILNLYNELKSLSTEYDVLIINDCSTDDSLKILQDNNIPHLNLLLNLGIGGAVQTGYRYAYKKGYNIAVQLDGDGQHDPTWISKLIKPIKNGQADMVIGSRFLEITGFQSTTVRRIGISFFKFLILFLSGKSITDATSGFRAVNRSTMFLFSNDYAKDYPEPESNMLAIRNKLRVIEIPVDMRERQGGISSINTFKSIYYMIKVSISILLCAIRPQMIKK